MRYCGKSCSTALATVIPPTPESKIPIMIVSQKKDKADYTPSRKRCKKYRALCSVFGKKSTSLPCLEAAPSPSPEKDNLCLTKKGGPPPFRSEALLEGQLQSPLAGGYFFSADAFLAWPFFLRLAMAL